MKTLTFGDSSRADIWGRYCLETRTTAWRVDDVAYRERNDSEGAYLVNVAEHHMFYGFVFKHFANNTTISTPDNEDVFGIRMAREWNMCNHFLVPLTRHDSGVEH